MTPHLCPLFQNKAAFQKIENFEAYKLYRCVDCGVQFWWPLQNALNKEFYETSHMYDIVGERPPSWYHEQFIKHPPLREGRLLDVGFGQGEFLNAIRSFNFELWGIDIAARNVEKAREKYHLNNLRSASLEEFAGSSGAEPFDIITAFELLEHLPDPAGFLDLVKKSLKRNGYFVMSTPNFNRFGGAEEAWDFPPNHLFRWDKRIVMRLLEAKGFTVYQATEQPFTRDFFVTRGTFSFGLMRFLGQRRGEVYRRGVGLMYRDVQRRGNYPLSRITKVCAAFARCKNAVMEAFTLPLEHIVRLFGCKYWSLYIVARANT